MTPARPVTAERAPAGVSPATLDTLYAEAGAARWQVSPEAFAAAVAHAVARVGAAAGGESIDADTAARTLHVRDLALAMACAAGHGEAWDHFVMTFRPELYRAARAMTDEATGRELADSLYADLFGLTERDGERRSLFRYYHGRAKLGTWLRSVLAQRHVDLVRSRRRTASLDDDAERPVDDRLAAPAAIDPATRGAMRVAALAVTAALGTLAMDDRRRLAYYYVHGLKLMAIGRLFDESEATASRKLERARQALGAAIDAELSARRLSRADVDDWAAVAREAWEGALAEALGVDRPQDPGPSAFKGKRTS